MPVELQSDCTSQSRYHQVDRSIVYISVYFYRLCRRYCTDYLLNLSSIRFISVVSIGLLGIMSCLVVLVFCVTLSAFAITHDEIGLCTLGVGAKQNMWLAGAAATVPLSSIFNVKAIHLAAPRCGNVYRPRHRVHLSSSLIALLLLVSGLELNPGPAINMGFYNAQSIVLGGPLVKDLIASHHWRFVRRGS